MECDIRLKHKFLLKKDSFTGLFEHRWDCAECDKTWFLSVDMSKDRDRKRLDKFYSDVSIHCINFNHSVAHWQKEKTFLRRL